MKERNKLENIFYGFVIWFSLGVILTFVFCAMKISGSHSTDPFYDVGEVWEIRSTKYNSFYQEERGHQEESGKIVLDDGYFRHDFPDIKHKNKLHYFCVKLEGISSDTSVKWLFYFKKLKGDEVVDVQTVEKTMHNGLNIIKTADNNFNNIQVDITGEKGTSFYIKSLVLRENKPVFVWKSAIKLAAISFLVYAILSFGVMACCKVYKKSRKHQINTFSLYSWIELLQDIYILLGHQLKRGIDRIPYIKTHKRTFRRLLFSAMLLYSVFVDLQRNYYLRFKYHLVIFSVLLIFLTALSVEERLERKNWNHMMVWSWIVFWCSACVSDFLDMTVYRYSSYVMLLIIPFFAFVWNNMKKPEELLQDFLKSVHVFFVCTVLFCIIFRPETESIRYCGISNNPAITGLCMGSIIIMLLGELENAIKNRKASWILLLYVFEGVVAISFCWKSQAACPLLCIAGIGIIWLWRITHFSDWKSVRKQVTFILICAIVLLVPVYKTVDWSINHIPYYLNTGIEFEHDQFDARNTYGMVVYAADDGEQKESRLADKFSKKSLSGILSGRDHYYRTYLRNMNLFGHDALARMWAKKRLPHNSVLGMAYRYGVFCAIPYIVFLCSAIIQTYRYSKRNRAYSAIPFFGTLSFAVMSMIDNIEQPFVWLPWFCMYMTFGIVFDKEQLISEKNYR